MITINSFLHREVLNDIIRRWMYDEARPSDADLITRLVHFNHIFVARYLDLFAGRIFRGLHPGALSSRSVQIKGDLKDALFFRSPYRNERIEELIRDYHRNPGRFYRGDPFPRNALLHPAQWFFGLCRIKPDQTRPASCGEIGPPDHRPDLRHDQKGMPKPWRMSGRVSSASRGRGS